jgi:NADH-quinone oxidoreductase subunit D
MKEKILEELIDEEILELNMGPQHPSTHGVLRLILKISNERIKDLRICIGYLHRGIEKLSETLSYHQIIPLTDRLDYVNSGANNLAYCLAVEKLIGIEKDIPQRANYIRVLIAELNRIASHLVWFSTQPLDLGAFTPFLYGFREREKLMDIFEEYCGARMTHSCIAIGGVRFDITKKVYQRVKEFIKIMPKKLKDYHALLTKNPILLARMKNIGIIDKKTALAFGITGPILRGCGVKYDIRDKEPYCIYDKLSFEIPTGKIGDVYDRYLVRLKEIQESLNIINQIIDNIPEGKILVDIPWITLPDKSYQITIEDMIRHFEILLKRYKVRGRSYACIESPKGELGFYIVANGEASPYRLRIRAPSFANIFVLEKIAKEHLIADLVAIVGSLDPCMGEVDR